MDSNAIDWQKLKENVSIKNLSKEKLQIDLFKLEPNASFDEHEHEQTEWLFILKGEYSDQNGTYSAGHFVVNPKGSKHATKSGPQGCELLVIKLKE